MNRINQLFFCRSASREIASLQIQNSYIIYFSIKYILYFTDLNYYKYSNFNFLLRIGKKECCMDQKKIFVLMLLVWLKVKLCKRIVSRNIFKKLELNLFLENIFKVSKRESYKNNRKKRKSTSYMKLFNFWICNFLKIDSTKDYSI